MRATQAQAGRVVVPLSQGALMPKIMGKRIVLITREEYELLACGWCRPADVPKRKGTADMVIGQGGITDMVEAKSGAKAKLEPGQKTFAEKWRGRPVVVLRNRSEAEAWARRERHERRRQSEAKALAAVVPHG